MPRLRGLREGFRHKEVPSRCRWHAQWQKKRKKKSDSQTPPAGRPRCFLLNSNCCVRLGKSKWKDVFLLATSALPGAPGGRAAGGRRPVGGLRAAGRAELTWLQLVGWRCTGGPVEENTHQLLRQIKSASLDILWVSMNSVTCRSRKTRKLSSCVDWVEVKNLFDTFAFQCCLSIMVVTFFYEKIISSSPPSKHFSPLSLNEPVTWLCLSHPLTCKSTSVAFSWRFSNKASHGYDWKTPHGGVRTFLDTLEKFFRAQLFPLAVFIAIFDFDQIRATASVLTHRYLVWLVNAV